MKLESKIVREYIVIDQDHNHFYSIGVKHNTKVANKQPNKPIKNISLKKVFEGGLIYLFRELDCPLVGGKVNADSKVSICENQERELALVLETSGSVASLLFPPCLTNFLHYTPCDHRIMCVFPKPKRKFVWAGVSLQGLGVATPRAGSHLRGGHCTSLKWGTSHRGGRGP